MKTEELLFTTLENIDKLKSSVIINRMLNYNPDNPTKLTPVITMSITSSCLTLSITDNDKCNFSITSIEDGFVTDFYNLESEGLFKEVYNAIKHLLVIEV